MIDSGLFDKLVCIYPVTNSSYALNAPNQEHIARMVRGNELPFGGIQVSRSHLHRVTHG